MSRKGPLGPPAWHATANFLAFATGKAGAEDQFDWNKAPKFDGRNRYAEVWGEDTGEVTWLAEAGHCEDTETQTWLIQKVEVEE